ncbi:type IV pilus assembly protein PilN [Ectothiorhodospira magna]|uniref:Type IV pilus assembly protein PilN n=1 Tax=Ectothiorhodospira magna TaxID=867345 RepID=A0A1H9B890_9GAMM|nr:PilN domain-containing protein [Ectothiorhodospira magna]SEP85240.1 type IV pilus assembly protein PilN [Ectothiorhodospira magna]
MTHINLLPWREERRKERQKNFNTITALVMLASLVAVFLAHTYVERLIDHQQQRNQLLQNEIRLLDRKIAEIQDLEATRRALVDRMNIIQELQTTRPTVVRLFDELVTTLPNGVYLTAVTQRGNTLEIAGRAESNARVSIYMRNLEASPWFSDPNLQVVETQVQSGVRLSDFRLTVRLVTPRTTPTGGSR